MKTQTKQSKISAAFFAGNITVKQAAKMARKARRAAVHKGRKSNAGRYS